MRNFIVRSIFIPLGQVLSKFDLSEHACWWWRWWRRGGGEARRRQLKNPPDLIAFRGNRVRDGAKCQLLSRKISLLNQIQMFGLGLHTWARATASPWDLVITHVQSINFSGENFSCALHNVPHFCTFLHCFNWLFNIRGNCLTSFECKALNLLSEKEL